MIVDASVVMRSLTPQRGSSSADRLFARDDLAAPDILPLELGHAITKRLRQGHLSPDQAMESWLLLAALPIVLSPTRRLYDGALNLSLSLRAGYYDCVYLELALIKGVPLVTADDRFVRAVRADQALAPHIVELADL